MKIKTIEELEKEVVELKEAKEKLNEKLDSILRERISIEDSMIDRGLHRCLLSVSQAALDTEREKSDFLKLRSVFIH